MPRETRPAPTPACPFPRVVVEGVEPEIDGGRYPIKRTVGETVDVTVHAHADGHENLRVLLLHRPEANRKWQEAPMQLEGPGTDLWRGSFRVGSLEPYQYTVTAWIDRFDTWRQNLAIKLRAGQAERVDFLAGAKLIGEASLRSSGADGARLSEWADALGRVKEGGVFRLGRRVLTGDLAELMRRYPDRQLAATYPRELAVTVDRVKARFGTWYEMFPRSASPDPGRHGTFKDCQERLKYVAEMGFDILYLPPIHPIGRTHRKGRNNTARPLKGDPGSPWAIGASEGGHKSLHPELGTLQDFRHLLARASDHGLEVAMDLAFQCNPDHPYVRDHPEWFRSRPDGTIQYAENPPKKYQDIYPLDFETDHWEELVEELKSVVLFWMEEGIRIFRVDNPHTKPFRFWEWLIREIKKASPDVIFLGEAFTRPRVRYHLAKLGFTQSYTYFAWRNTKRELTEYFTELTQSKVWNYFRPNLWTNTPDILTEYLQLGGRPAFAVRLVLAATLGASYGIYGPPFELGENRPVKRGSEEYLNSEKYEIRHWDLERPESLKDLIGTVNRIRRENSALQSDRRLRFHPVGSEHLIAYTKTTADRSNTILTVVNLDPRHPHSGQVELSAVELGLDRDRPLQVEELLSRARSFWQDTRNLVCLDPKLSPAKIFRLHQRGRGGRAAGGFV